MNAFIAYGLVFLVPILTVVVELAMRAKQRRPLVINVVQAKTPVYMDDEPTIRVLVQSNRSLMNGAWS